MSADLTPRSSALPSVERARALLAETRSTHEVKKIRAVAQAVATLERGKEIAIDAGEIVLLADARIGELTREMPKAPAGDARAGRSPKSVSPTQVKRDHLAREGITKQQAAECERVADLQKSGDLDRYVSACRNAKQMPTTSGAVALARLPEPARNDTLAKLRDVPDVRKAIGEVRLATKRALAETIRARFARSRATRAPSSARAGSYSGRSDSACRE